MALKRITMQDIADACGLSRNTVSKIFNERGSVPEATRRLVLTKARELGYSASPAGIGLPGSAGSGTVAVLTQHKLLSHTFGAYFITSFTDQLSRFGYTIKMYEVSAGEIAAKELPPHLLVEQIAAILVIELFDREYLDMICSLQKPTVFVDGYARMSAAPLGCDFISMENVSSETALVRRMIAAGARRLGFVGDCEHCNSFYERHAAFRAVLGEAGLPYDPSLCILAPDSELYGDSAWLLRQLAAMPSIPDGFACANDYLAIRLMGALKKLGLSIPGDVLLTGFDGSPEAAIVEPSLTTARIPSAELGRLAAVLLSERIRLPEFPFVRTYVKTAPIWGNSTVR